MNEGSRELSIFEQDAKILPQKLAVAVAAMKT